MPYAMQNQLNYWYNNYVDEPTKCSPPTFLGFIGDWGDRTTLGSFQGKYVDGRKTGDIKLVPWIEKYPRLRLGVLWHEFCHMEVWGEEGDVADHGKEFKDRLKRDRKLYWYDILAKILCPLLNHS